MLLPGLPGDDPPTTWRGEYGRVLEVLLVEDRAEVADLVRRRYRVPVATVDNLQVDNEVVPDSPANNVPEPPGEQAFLAAVREAGFGVKAMSGDLSPLVRIARNMVAAMRRGVPAEDLGRALFDSDARPTMAQVRTFIDAAVRCFDPTLVVSAGVNEFSRPVTVGEALARNVSLHAAGRT